MVSPRLIYYLPNNCFFYVSHIESGTSKLCDDKSNGPDGQSGEFLFMLLSALSYPLVLCIVNIASPCMKVYILKY